jgi:hypothetical protein
MTFLRDGINYLGTEQSLEGWSNLLISSIFMTCLVKPQVIVAGILGCV